MKKAGREGRGVGSPHWAERLGLISTPASSPTSSSPDHTLTIPANKHFCMKPPIHHGGHFRWTDLSLMADNGSNGRKCYASIVTENTAERKDIFCFVEKVSIWMFIHLQHSIQFHNISKPVVWSPDVDVVILGSFFLLVFQQMGIL